MASKDKVRAELVAGRDGVPSGTRAQWSQQICDHLAHYSVVQQAQSVAVYAPIRSEVDVIPLVVMLLQRRIHVCFPRVDRAAGQLVFVPVTHVAQTSELPGIGQGVGGLVPGYRGILEPQGEAVPQNAIDVVMVPGVGFDRRGGRMGYGAGWYDRTLAGYSGWCIGVAFAMQVVDCLPIQAHDRLMNDVVTETGAVGPF